MSGRIYRTPSAALADSIMRDMEETAQLDAREPGGLIPAAAEVDFARELAAIDARTDSAAARLDLDHAGAVDWMRHHLTAGPRFAEDLIALWQVAAGDADAGAGVTPAAALAPTPPYEIAAEIMFAAADALKVEWRAMNDAGEGLQWRLPDAGAGDGAVETTAMPRPASPHQAAGAAAAAPPTTPAAVPFTPPPLVPKDSGCLCEKCTHRRLSGAFADMRREDLATHAQLIAAWGVTWPYDINRSNFN